MISSLYSKTVIILIVFTMFSCVPARKMQDVNAKYDRAKKENIKCQEELAQALRQNDDYKEQLDKLEKNIARLVKDTADFRSRYRQIEKLNKRLNELYEQVIAQNKNLLTNSSSQNQMLTMDLENKKRDLELKERALALREQEVNRLKEDLKEREAKVNELEDILSKKDNAVKSLKKKIADALQGFSSSELTVENKNGKVYVSMSENLLFSSGSTVVGAKGVSAVKKVAAVLMRTKGVNILVEGHTDNVPMKGSGEIKDNLDLSVMRATSIARILINAGLDAKMVTSAGRGEHFPVASNSTAIGRAKNRRTEIILTPNLDELLKILESN